MLSPHYIAYVLRTLKRTGMIPNHPDAVAVIEYAKEQGLVKQADGRTVVTADGWDFVIDFIEGYD